MKRSQLKRRMRGGEMRICLADGCTSEFYASPSAIIRGQGKFCSRSCAYRSRRPQTSDERAATRKIMLAKDRRGARNPNFKHGRKTGHNLRGWNPAAKGEECCRLCGDPNWLNLHHVVPRAICPPEARRDLRNGIVLCASCHNRYHKGSLVLTRDLFTAEEWAYISSLSLTGRDITGWLDKHYPAVEVAA